MDYKDLQENFLDRMEKVWLDEFLMKLHATMAL